MTTGMISILGQIDFNRIKTSIRCNNDINRLMMRNDIFNNRADMLPLLLIVRYLVSRLEQEQEGQLTVIKHSLVNLISRTKLMGRTV